jgi:hypothetical protein
VTGLAAIGVFGLAIGACGRSRTAAANPSVQATCQHVSAILSDGPDPGADPVGNAEAQILPLGTVHSSDRGLGKAISGLDAAYRAVYATDGSTGAVAEETRAGSALDAVCPGATG